jgi:predicted Zn finger-like uncharacterized protein
MALTISCPKCRTAMRVEEKQLGTKGRCVKCGEVFTLIADAAANQHAAPIHNPFANPFGAPPAPVEESPEAVATSSGFYGFQFSAPPPPSAPTPTVAAPGNPPVPGISPFEPFPHAAESPTAEPTLPPPIWPPFQESGDPSTYETISEPAYPSPPPPAYAPRVEAPPVLEMSAPQQTPLMEQKIAAVETFVVKLAARRTLRGPYGAVIREGKATTRLFVKITSTSGAAGWGEANPLLALQGATVESTAALVRRFLRPGLEGAVLADVNGWLRRLERTSPADSGPSAIAKSVVEMACLDLMAKTIETPLHVLWGGARAKSANIASLIDAESPKPIDEQLKRSRERGATAFHLVLDGNEAKDRAALAAVSKSLPDGCTFSVGFLRGHQRDAAVRLCAVAEGVGATALRGILATSSPLEIARLAERREISLLADVKAPGPEGVMEFIRHGGIGGVVLQPALLGWRNSWKSALIAQAAGVRVWLAMQMEGGLGLAAAAHFAAAIGTDAPILDGGRGYCEAHFIPEPTGDGPMKLSEHSGVGVSVDEGLLRAAAVDAG